MNINTNTTVLNSNKSSPFIQNVNKQNTAASYLNRLVEEKVNNVQQGQDLLKKKTQNQVQTANFNAKYDAYVKESDEIANMSIGMLKSIAAELKGAGVWACRFQKDIGRVQNNLKMYDSGIEQLQNMADGKTSLPEGVSEEEMFGYLSQIKAARKQYLEMAGEFFNKYDIKKTMRMVLGMASGGSGNDYTAMLEGKDLHIDEKSSDFYGEMDRVVWQLDEIRAQVDDALKEIYKEMDRRQVSESECPRDFIGLRSQSDDTMYTDLTMTRERESFLDKLLKTGAE